MVANPTVDVLGALAELELGHMHADHDQAELGVVAIPRLDVGRGADPVDAGVLPEVDQNDLAAQRIGGERRRVHPALHLESGQFAGGAGEARTGDDTEEQERQDGSHEGMPSKRRRSCVDSDMLSPSKPVACRAYVRGRTGGKLLN